MSYILEALKKAQAERQLGDLPTIHAAQVVPVAPARLAARGKPLLIGVAAGVVVAGAAATLYWRYQAPPQVAVLAQAPAANATSIPAPAPGETASPVAARMAERGTGQVQPAAGQVIAAPLPAVPARHDAPAPAHAAPPAPAHAAQPSPAPGASLAAVPERVQPPPPHAQPVRQDPLAGHQSAAPVRTASAAPAASTVADERAPVPAARTPAAVPAAEEYVRTLAELPDTIRREVPKVAFGGYMYSPDPADRLVLVDKTLRHEGEEVAPGLLLEKLLPKTAVLNYKGYRFRVGL